MEVLVSCKMTMYKMVEGKYEEIIEPPIKTIKPKDIFESMMIHEVDPAFPNGERTVKNDNFEKTFNFNKKRKRKN